jgi:hypothetical protein
MSQPIEQEPKLLGESFAHLREQRRIVLVGTRCEGDFYFRLLGLLLRLPVPRSSAEMASAADS